MPSHQDRREPLPEGYQYGDSKPKLPHHVTVSRSTFRALLKLWEFHYLNDSGCRFNTELLPSVDTITLTDTVFHRGDY